MLDSTQWAGRSHPGPRTVPLPLSEEQRAAIECVSIHPLDRILTALAFSPTVSARARCGAERRHGNEQASDRGVGGGAAGQAVDAGRRAAGDASVERERRKVEHVRAADGCDGAAAVLVEKPHRRRSREAGRGGGRVGAGFGTPAVTGDRSRCDAEQRRRRGACRRSGLRPRRSTGRTGGAGAVALRAARGGCAGGCRDPVTALGAHLRGSGAGESAQVVRGAVQ